MAEGGRGILRRSEDVRTLAFAGVFLGLLGLQLAWTPPVWLALPLWGLTCAWAFVGAVSTHNIIHTPVFRRPRMNDALRILHTWWYGQPVTLFVPVHNHSHHKHAQTRKDLTRTTKVTGQWQLLNLWNATRWGPAAARDSKLYLAPHKARNSKVWRQFQRELIGLGVFYAATLVLCVAVFGWWKFPVYVVLPHFTGQFWIKAINFLQHDGCDYDQDGYDHSRNFTGPVFNWFLLNNGYHTVHHLRPGWHWADLPAKHAELVAPHMHPALEIRHAASWFLRWAILPGRRERFDGTPWEGLPGGEGPDLPWSAVLEVEHDARAPAPARRAS